MPTFHYRALSQTGEIVSGSISAPSAAEVDRRIEYLGLVPIDAVSKEGKGAAPHFSLAFLNQPRAEDITVFTRDFALLLKAGARLDTALELLATDIDIGRLHPIIGKVRASVLGGESLADAVSQHPAVFPSMYVARPQVRSTISLKSSPMNEPEPNCFAESLQKHLVIRPSCCSRPGAF